MHWSKEAVIAFLAVMVGCVSTFGRYAGYATGAVPKPDPLPATAPGLLQLVDFLWESAKFLFLFAAFQVPGIPTELALVFDIMCLVAVLVIILIARGV